MDRYPSYDDKLSSVSSLLLLSPAAICTSLVACLVLLLVLVNLRRSSNRHLPPPQPAGSQPILGHLLLLGGPDTVMHRTLGKLADKSGPIFMLKLGLLRGLVISNSEMAKECLSTHDVAFSDRPRSLAIKILGCNYAMLVASPYGPYWREVRKIATSELLSARRLSLPKQTLISEVRASIRELYQQWDDESSKERPLVKIDMSKWFADLALNSTLQLIAGKSMRGFSGTNERDHCHKTFRDFMSQLGEVTLSDALPFLKWLDIGGLEKAMKKTAAELDAIIQGWLDGHRRERDLGLKIKRDFMDVMLDLLIESSTTTSDGKFFDYDVDTVIKATCLAMVLGGVETTSTTLTWAVSLLLNHPHILEKAKEELSAHIGKERKVNESDLEHLTYLHAIIKETMRLNPPGPLIPRESRADVVVGGYHVPKGTRIFINVFKTHRDPLLYQNPDEFCPERFLGRPDFNARGNDFEFLPFGGRRRVCPGIPYTHQAVPLVLANLLHNFDISRPSVEPIDMTEAHGVSNAKSAPLEVLLTPVLPRHLYED